MSARECEHFEDAKGLRIVQVVRIVHPSYFLLITVKAHVRTQFQSGFFQTSQHVLDPVLLRPEVQAMRDERVDELDADEAVAALPLRQLREVERAVPLIHFVRPYVGVPRAGGRSVANM